MLVRVHEQTGCDPLMIGEEHCTNVEDSLHLPCPETDPHVEYWVRVSKQSSD